MQISPWRDNSNRYKSLFKYIRIKSMPHLVYPALSYKIIGILYSVYNELGSGYQEKYYQKAVRVKFEKEKIKFQEQIPVELTFEDKNIGRYFLDFLVENKIILELKTAPNFRKRDYQQVRSYLKAKNLELGILVIFTREGVKYKRILNRIY